MGCLWRVDRAKWRGSCVVPRSLDICRGHRENRGTFPTPSSADEIGLAHCLERTRHLTRRRRHSVLLDVPAVYCQFMADRSRFDDAVVTKTVVQVVDWVNDRLADATSTVQKTLELEIGELRGDPQLLDLMHASIEGNVATILNAIHHGIPIERVESPTAALEYARRLAQRGVPANALVRAYRIGHKVVLDMIVEGIHQVGADPALGLDVFGRISAISFRYIDWISQQAVG